MSLAVLVSGTGSILDAMVEAGLPITLVVSDRPCPAMEKAAGHDVEAVVALRRGFNRWLDEDWGFDYRDRIYAAPYLSLADADEAVIEPEWCLDQGARLSVMRPAAAWPADGPRSPGAPPFDPFWARGSGAGIPVVACARAVRAIVRITEAAVVAAAGIIRR